jgi:predicted nucleic acid-binding protein
MHIVDSSGWLEYFSDGPNADYFAPLVQDLENLLVPVICVYEVYKRVYRESGEAEADLRIGVMLQANVVPIDAALAVDAALISAEHKLPMADSQILATAALYEVTLWTQDAHFKNLPGVQFIPKPPA